MGKLRVYVDTSVFGGCFDEEFAEASRTFLRQVESGRFTLVSSALVQEELEPAPAHVQEIFAEYIDAAELVDVSEDTIALRQAYMDAKIVPEKALTDALHVALATSSQCDILVSWNFQHIVHYRRIPLYNAVNVLHGYGSISIYSPLEVIEYEENL